MEQGQACRSHSQEVPGGVRFAETEAGVVFSGTGGGVCVRV